MTPSRQPRVRTREAAPRYGGGDKEVEVEPAGVIVSYLPEYVGPPLSSSRFSGQTVKQTVRLPHSRSAVRRVEARLMPYVGLMPDALCPYASTGAGGRHALLESYMQLQSTV